MNKLRYIVMPILFCFLVLIPATGYTVDMPQDISPGYFPPGPDEVQIAFSGVAMPLERMLLIRKDSKYCAMKFTRFWTEKDKKEKFATYEVYYQGDGTGDFFNKNVNVIEEKASLLPPRGPFYPLIWQPGNPEVKCGSLRLLWAYKGVVCFFERMKSPGDYGIELAPTPWTTIKEVNVSDPRVRWYRYDENRKRVNIPIDQLWNITEQQEKRLYERK